MAFKTKNFRYPFKNIDKSDDYLKIESLRYRPPGLNIDLKSFAQPSSDNAGYGPQDIRGTVILPIPEGIADANGVKWGDASMGPLETLGVAAGLGVVSSVDMFKGLQESAFNVLDISKDAAKQGTVQKMIQSFFTTKAVEALTGSEGLFQQTLGRYTGAAFNENIELLFNGVTLREAFSFKFDMVPRSKEESNEIKEIIRFFKSEMAARKGLETGPAAGLFLTAPSVFRVQYMSGGKPHPFLNKIKICALTGSSVEYTGSGTYATYSDATPVHMILNLTFQELTPIYHEDYVDQNGNFKLEGTGY